MTKHQLRTRVGIILVLGHIMIVCVLVGFTVASRTPFGPGEGSTAIALVVPMFAAYTAAVLTHLINEQQVQEEPDAKPQPTASGEFVFYSFLFPSLLICFLLATILAKTMLSLGFEQFKWMIAIGETLFGVYVAQFVKALFES